MKRMGAKARNEVLLQAIAALEKASRKQRGGIWKAAAEKLKKPRRQRISVNLWKVNAMHEKMGEKFLLVPGKVLGFGALDRAVNVIAFEFSGDAKEQIGRKGRALTIMEALKENIKASEVAIVC